MQKHTEHLTHRVITLLDRQEMDFLDKVGKDALFSTGHKLSYNAILRGLIDFAIELGLPQEKIDSLRTLREKIKEHIYNPIIKSKQHKGEAEND